MNVEKFYESRIQLEFHLVVHNFLFFISINCSDLTLFGCDFCNRNGLPCRRRSTVCFAEDRTATFSEISVKNPLAVIARACGAGLVSLVLMSTDASAAIYRQVIDPPIYFGVGLFDVASDCIPTTTGVSFFTPGVDCGQVDIIDLLLQGNSPPDGTIRFAGPQPTNVITDSVIGLLWFDQTLVGIDTTSLLGFGTGDFSNPGGYLLQYSAGPHVAPSNESFNPTAQLSCNTFSDSTSTFSIAADVISDPGQCLALANGGGVSTQEAATLVPEPGTISLLLAALGLVWFQRRRQLCCNVN